MSGGRVEPDNGCEEMLKVLQRLRRGPVGDAALVLMGVKMMKVPEPAVTSGSAEVLPDRERMAAYESADVTIIPCG